MSIIDIPVPASRAGRTSFEATTAILKSLSRSGYIPVPGDVPTIGFGTTEGVKTGKPACALECSSS
ncbi:hypothetical protein LH425_06445 [Laribacter hongkongensis]|uniref:hypothetical protein n=1 Tax=Laribacter hongkongensis TaxID=168471 RepID=UPI001EFD83C7|nr:hypothetical protein [Laribacter hongkongensis]MCG9064682.1 hypothetical protein [Laribacter hongkongensis]